MKRLFSFMLAILVALSLPMTALAEIVADTSYGDINIGDTGVNHVDSTGDVFSSYEDHGTEVTVQHGNGSKEGSVTVEMTREEVTITGNVDSVNAGGNVSGSNDGVSISKSSVEVAGNVSGNRWGVTWSNANTMTVGGRVSGNDVDIYIYRTDNEIPDLSVGAYDTLDSSSYVSEEELELCRENNRVTGLPEEPAVPGETPAPAAAEAKKPASRTSAAVTDGYSKGALWRGGYIIRTLYKVENGAGMKPVWEEALFDGVLTVTVENEPVVFIVWLQGLKELEKLGIRTIVIKTAACETELILADLMAMNGTEYILIQEGETAALTVDGESEEI